VHCSGPSLAFGHAETPRVITARREGREIRTHKPANVQALQRLRRHTFGKSCEKISHGPRIGLTSPLRTPLRMDSPPIGWVTALAGLLARGSPPLVQPSQF